MSDSLDYFKWIEKQADGIHARGRHSCLPAAAPCRDGGCYIGTTWVPDDLTLEQWHAATLEAAETMLSDVRFNDVGPASFNGRALTNTEMWAVIHWHQFSMPGMIDRWIRELYQELEAKHGRERVTRIDEDQCASEDSLVEQGAQGESESDF